MGDNNRNDDCRRSFLTQAISKIKGLLGGSTEKNEVTEVTKEQQQHQQQHQQQQQIKQTIDQMLSNNIKPSSSSFGASIAAKLIQTVAGAALNFAAQTISKEMQENEVLMKSVLQKVLFDKTAQQLLGEDIEMGAITSLQSAESVINGKSKKQQVVVSQIRGRIANGELYIKASGNSNLDSIKLTVGKRTIDIILSDRPRPTRVIDV